MVILRESNTPVYTPCSCSYHYLSNRQNYQNLLALAITITVTITLRPIIKVSKGKQLPNKLISPETTIVRAYNPDQIPNLNIGVREASDGGDGKTLFGHFAVFDRWTEIDSFFEGNFMERIAPGAFKKTIKERRDQMKPLFNHGRDPELGMKPLGNITELREDAIGAYYEIRLIDTYYNRDFIIPASRANLLGSSFRFGVIMEQWNEEPGTSRHNPKGLPERTLQELRVDEFGPVTFPAYVEASSGLRNMPQNAMDELVSRLRETLNLNHIDSTGISVDRNRGSADNPAAGSNIPGVPDNNNSTQQVSDRYKFMRELELESLFK